MNKKVMICGSRFNCDKEKALQVIHQHLSQYKDAEILCGDALGVDAWVVEYAVAHNIPITVYGIGEKWRNLNGYAERVNKVSLPCTYTLRDEQMVELAQVVICIWNGSSTGTRHVYEYALTRGKVAILKSGRVS